MRDEQAQRYARHLSLPDVGGLGQTALLVSAARLALREPEPDAELIAGAYLAAGGVGTLAVAGASAAQRAELAAHGPDTRVVDGGVGRDVALAPRPAWWPHADGDAVALAYFRGALAATRWMTETVAK
ncbi:MAG TPA: hypothetical protein VLX92_12665 [Kofleriaceae bacterium]|nr:hypothetical protein [Kofleriaceae bacterium]